MNEYLRKFIMTGIRDMIEKEIELYQTYKYASSWYEKGVLKQEDLEEIEKKYEEKGQKEQREENKEKEEREE